MHSINIQTIFLALGLASQAHGHAYSPFPSPLLERDVALYGPFSRRNLEPGFTKRQAGAKCGATAGGASCGPGQCCSDQGICGTGGAFCTAPACQLAYGPACDGNKTPPGSDTSKDPRPALGNVPTGVVIKSCTVPGTVALTFDDGPYIFTATLLDTLSAAGVKATFFVTGINGGKGEIDNKATGYPALLQRMIKEGHQIASHTWSHADLTLSTRQQRMDQMIKNEIALTDALGFFPAYMRPPYSFTNADVLTDLKTLGYHVINFDVDTLDWVGDYVAAKKNFITPLNAGNKASSSFLVLSHDIHQQTVTDLVPYMIQNIKALGYTATTVGECLGDPRENWYRDPKQGLGVKNATSDILKVSGNSTANTTLPTASVSAGAFGAQSSGHANSSTNGTTLKPSTAGSGSKTGEAVALSAMGTVALLSMVAFFVSFV